MYFAAMRPAEVIHLRIEQCHLPKTGWGMLNLSGGAVTSGKEWTDGEVHEVHSLSVARQARRGLFPSRRSRLATTWTLPPTASHGRGPGNTP
ncbi:hypothetical protein GCM10010422_14740 [Streptomyces graminearus]